MNWTDQPMPEAIVTFADLGLPANEDYLVYEFWSRKFLGVRRGHFNAATLESKGLSLYAIRTKLDHPQLVSTNRHISQGGADLEAVEWRNDPSSLQGRSKVVQGDAYEMVVFVPDNFVFDSADVAGTPSKIVAEDSIVRVSYLPVVTGSVTWTIRFTKRS